MGVISELHSFNTLALRPSGQGALCMFKPFNSLRTPLGSTVISPMGMNGLVPLLLFFFFFVDNGTPSVTEDYLPCAIMLFTMKFG